MIGILGGMGPLATIDLMRKIYENTPASSDQQHIPMLVHADPTVPDRTTAINDPDAPSPLPKLLQGIGNLARGGADFIAIACNTAHYWHRRLQAASSVPVLDMIEIACAACGIRCAPGTTVGVLATSGTIASQLYQRQLSDLGLQHLVSSSPEDVRWLWAAIDATKAGRPADGAAPLAALVHSMAGRGATTVLLACTELPVVWSYVPPEQRPSGLDAVDPTAVLAAECVRRSLARRLAGDLP